MALVLGAGVACSDVEERPPLSFVQAEAGHPVVELSTLSGWPPTGSPRRVASTNDLEGGPLLLNRVHSGLFLGDSALVIADSGNGEVVVLDLRQSPRARTVAPPGRGPGELGRIIALTPSAGAEFFVYDGRLHHFDASAAYRRTTDLPSRSRRIDLLPLVIRPDSSLLYVPGDQRVFDQPGLRRDTVPLILASSSGERSDTLATWLGLEREIHPTSLGKLMVPVGYGRTFAVDSNGSEVVIGSTDSLALRVVNAAGETVFEIGSDDPPARVPSDARSAWIEHLEERLPIDNAEVRRAFAASPVRETLPAFAGLKIDPDGGVWIGEAIQIDARARRWIGLSREGDVLGVVEVPRLPFDRLPGRTEIIAFARHHFALLRKNYLDEEWVEVWRLPDPDPS